MLSPVFLNVRINNRMEYALREFAVITNQEGVEQGMRNDSVAGMATLLKDCDMLQKCSSMNLSKIRAGFWVYRTHEVTLQQLRLKANNFARKGTRVQG